ncbi:MAG: hypothetical protein EOO69_10445 [Moraxellaceae bacterium]|nr:MAG: hypothetical protein EOO69_10445 [Moraxellaceae bacterium]
MRIHATALQTSEGDNAEDILDSLKNYKAAQLDSQLVNAMGVHILSRRIDIAEDEFELIADRQADTDDLTIVQPSRFTRMAVIVQRIIQTLEIPLFQLAESMAQAAAWQARPEFEQPVLHPAWNGQREEHLTQHTEQVIDQIQQCPAHLQIHCFLPLRWDEQDYELIQTVMTERLQQLGFNVNQFSFNPVVVEDHGSQPALLADLLEHIKQDKKNMHFMLGADSFIDQNEIDEVIWDQPDYISAEAGYGLLISQQNIMIPMLDDDQNVFINADKQELLLNNPKQHPLFISPINPRLAPSYIKLLFNEVTDLELDTDQLLFMGSLLENVSDQSSGLGFVFSAALAQQQDNDIYLVSADTDHINFGWLFCKKMNKDINPDA